jgi:hypothetical protein
MFGLAPWRSSRPGAFGPNFGFLPRYFDRGAPTSPRPPEPILPSPQEPGGVEKPWGWVLRMLILAMQAANGRRHSTVESLQACRQDHS